MRKPLEAIQIGAISLEDHKFKIYILVNLVILLPEMYSIDTLPHANKKLKKDIHCNIVRKARIRKVLFTNRGMAK